jgi:GntR family transcriptional regulator
VTAMHGATQIDNEARRVRDVVGFDLVFTGRGRLTADEREIASLLGLSRQTVRSGLDLLRAEGIIERRRGAGTFIVPEAPMDAVGLAGVGHDVVGGERALYRTLFFGECHLPPAMAGLLGSAPGSPIGLVQRLSIVGDRPVSLWDNYLGARLLDVARDNIRLGESPALLEEVLGITHASIDLHLEPGIADESVAPLLGVNPGRPVLRYERVLRDTGGQGLLISFGYSRCAAVFEGLALDSAH